MSAFPWGLMQGNPQPLQSEDPGLQGETGFVHTLGTQISNLFSSWHQPSGGHGTPIPVPPSCTGTRVCKALL